MEACESLKRKKGVEEELQRSVIFFSRANSTLKQQHNELTHVLLQAQTQVKNAHPVQSHPNMNLSKPSNNLE
jgi:hypothetical protein